MRAGFMRAVLTSPETSNNIEFKCIEIPDDKQDIMKHFIGRRYRTWNSLRLSFAYRNLYKVASKPETCTASTYDSKKHLLTLDTVQNKQVLIVAIIWDIIYIVGISDSVYQNKAYKFI